MTFITDDEIKKVVQALKTQIDLADLDKTAVITEVPLSALTDAVLLINDLTAKIKCQQANIKRLKYEIAEQEHAKCIPCVEETKAQAFKEFADELMENYILPTKREIKKLLAKKVGEYK